MLMSEGIIMNEEKIKIFAIVNAVNALANDLATLHKAVEALLKVKEIELEEEDSLRIDYGGE